MSGIKRTSSSTSIANGAFADFRDSVNQQDESCDSDAGTEKSMSTDEEEEMEDYYSKRSLVRLRQNSEDDRHSVGLENDIIARFSMESLYSYSFNPAFLRTSRSGRTSRKHMIRRGVDFVKRLRYKLDDRTARRFSHPDIGGTMYTWQTSYWSAQNTPRTSIDYENGTNLMASLTVPDQADDMLSTSSSGSSSSGNGRRQTLPRSSADQGIPTALPPIYESVHGSVSPNPRSDATEKYYKRALHAPTRFLPQNQAIFTTTVDGTILLFNDIASLCFGLNKSYVGKPILPVLQHPFRKHVELMLSRRKAREGVRGKDSVLVCGNVVPVVKVNGELSAASLWLKEQERDKGQVVYIWIFEEIYESTLSTQLDSKGIVRTIRGKMGELFGYQSDHVIGKPIDLLIPQLKADGSINLTSIEQLKFFGARAKSGSSFPVMTALHPEEDPHQYSLKITSLPAIAGLITVHNNGTIQSISPVPAKYLFGYQHIETIAEKMNIDQLLPQFHDILTGLRRDGLWHHDGIVVGNQACRKALASPGLAQDAERKLAVSSHTGPLLPSIYAVHRDGSHFDVQLQLRSIESAEEDLISIWISFDRIHAVAPRNSNKRKASVALLSMKPAIGEGEDEDEHKDDVPAPLTDAADARDQDCNRKAAQRAVRTKTDKRERGSVEEVPESAQPDSETAPNKDHQWPPPLPTDGDRHPLDNYVIETSLGQGTYGTAMLAYCKDDETKKKVVIKSITKSRILVDSWMRDRRVGDLVPAEIHILRTLKQHPHINCCSLLTHMEDQEFYYVVMELYGDGMDLFDFIELNETISEQETRTIFRQVAEGVQHLHHNRIVHRDIKDENIILDESGTAVIIDFGSAAYYRECKKFETFCGTMDYWAPELLQGISYDGPPQDIWSLGILLHTLVFRETPFNQIDDILGDELRIRDLPYPGPTNLLHNMLSKDVASRPTIDEVLKDPWLVAQ